MSTLRRKKRKDEGDTKIPTRKDGDGNKFLQMFQRLFNPNQKQMLNDIPTQSLMGDIGNSSYDTYDTATNQSVYDSKNNLDSFDAQSVTSV